MSENGFSTASMVITTILFVGAALFLVKSRKNSSQVTDSELKSSEKVENFIEIDKKVHDHLAKIYKKYLPDFISYAVTEKSFTLPSDIRNDLAGKYGKKLSLPFIPWPDEINEQVLPTNYYSRLDICILDYMKNNNLLTIKSGSPTYMFREAMLEHANNTAKEIIDNVLRSKL